MTAVLQHRLLVEADAHPNVLLRLLEPFAIHDVLPVRMRIDGPADGRIDTVEPGRLSAEIAFLAPADVAERLCARIGVMVPVRSAQLLGVASAAIDVAA